MGELTRATLQAVEVTESGVRDLGDPFTVQFNPTSLRLQRTNNVTAQPGQRPTQSTGSDATLTVELVFDSADEGATDAPVDVRERSGMVAAFVLPGEGDGDAKAAPPSVRFAWGPIVVEGVMTSFSEDIDLFSADGVPLRSKVGITIKEQDAAVMGLRRGSGSNVGSGARRPGRGAGVVGGGIGIGISAGVSFGAGVGASVGAGITASAGLGAGVGAGLGLGAAARTTFALGGETPAELAARVGLDPAAWRALAVVGGSSGPALAPGVRVDVPSGAAAEGGLGRAALGRAAATGPDGAAAALSGALPPGRDGALAAGFALASAGGVVAADAARAAAEQQAGATRARDAFGTGSPVRATAPPPAPAGPPRPDPRAASFGRGVPLRTRIEVPRTAAPPAAPAHSCTCACRRVRRSGCGCGCHGGASWR